MMEAVHRYEGTVNQVMGDGIMALFGAPLADEDHAVRACYAALRMQESVTRYADEARRAHGVNVQIRVGLNSGEVVVRAVGSDLHMDYTAVGQTTHLAARMEQLAEPGTALLTQTTVDLVEGYVSVRALAPVPIKGLATHVELYQLAGAGAARSRLEATAARGLTKFVGRSAEIEHLTRVLDLTAGGHGQVVTVMGEPGVGKSRLVWEVTHSQRIGNSNVVQARDPGGQDVDFPANRSPRRGTARVEERSGGMAIAIGPGVIRRCHGGAGKQAGRGVGRAPGRRRGRRCRGRRRERR
jgi:hypothetical protein